MEQDSGGVSGELWNSTARPFLGENNENTVFILNPDEVRPSNNTMFFHIIFIYALTFVIGLVANVIAMGVMLVDRKNHSTTSMFLTSLTAADLLLVVVCIPIEMLHYFMGFQDSNSVCKLAKYTELLSPIASVLNLCAVSFERVIVVVFPMRSRSICTMRNCRRTIFLVWVSASILSLPVLWVVEGYSIIYTNNVTSVSVYYCQEPEPNWPLAVYQVIIIFGLPGLFLSVCYTYVIRELWKSTRTISMLTNASSFRASNTKRLPRTATRLSTVEEELTNTIQGRLQVPEIPVRGVSNVSTNSLRTEMTTLSEIDVTIHSGLTQGKATDNVIVKNEDKYKDTITNACRVDYSDIKRGRSDSCSPMTTHRRSNLVNEKDSNEVTNEIGGINGNAVGLDDDLDVDQIEEREESYRRKVSNESSELGMELKNEERIESPWSGASTFAVKKENVGLEKNIKDDDCAGESEEEELNEEMNVENEIKEAEERSLEKGKDISSATSECEEIGNSGGNILSSTLINDLEKDSIIESCDADFDGGISEHRMDVEREFDGNHTMDETLKRTRSRLHSIFRSKAQLSTQQIKAEEAKTARKQVILMLILVIVLFMVCWGPKLLFTAILKICDEGLKCEYNFFSPFWYKVKVFFNLISYVHSCINPFIYSFMSNNFKRSMKRQLVRIENYFGGCWYRCHGQQDDTEMPLYPRSQDRDRNRTLAGHAHSEATVTTNLIYANKSFRNS